MDPSIRRHFNDPRNRGTLTAPHGRGSAGEEGCGALIELQIRFDGDRIAEAAFTASGSAEIIAAGSILAVMIEARDWRDAASVTVAEIFGRLTGSTAPAAEKELVSLLQSKPSPDASATTNASLARSAQAADFAIEALHHTLEDSIRNGNFPEARATERDSVLIAMSGGVDSTTACLLAKQSGLRTVGLTMRLWSDPKCDIQGDAPSCCSPQAIRDAREACHKLGLPHLTVDCRDEFRNSVVADFIAEYVAGRTPNPCTRCNGAFRFPTLVNLADRLGAARVMTGHYARITGDPGHRRIERGRDSAKDQSYMLWAIEPGLLDRLEFPLGGITKEETRRLARGAGLKAHSRPESQEICFIPDNDYRRFVKENVADLPGEGKIVNRSGKKLGVHRGYIDFTIGQRHGLGISTRKPLYVLGTIPETNTVVAGTYEELAVRRLVIRDVRGNMENSVAPREGNGSAPQPDTQVQIRYSSRPVRCTIVSQQEDVWEIELDTVYGVAPGQSAVIYQGDAVAAGGVIASTG